MTAVKPSVAIISIAACARPSLAESRNGSRKRNFFGQRWFSGSDPNFPAKRSEAPAGRAAGSGNLGSDFENARFLAPLPNSHPFPHPCGCAEERREKRIRDRDCLSAASSSGTPLFPSTAGCPQRSGGTQEPGSPFFSLGFFGETKKSKSPAAAIERHRSLTNILMLDSAQGFSRFSPSGVTERERIQERACSGSEQKFLEPLARLRVLRFATQRIVI